VCKLQPVREVRTGRNPRHFSPLLKRIKKNAALKKNYARRRVQQPAVVNW
jgi:hypothetical protein